MTARWVADMIGAAAQLELADFIDLGAKTAEEIAKAKGLHATGWVIHTFSASDPPSRV